MKRVDEILDEIIRFEKELKEGNNITNGKEN